MKMTNYLVRIGRNYYFRIRYPQDVVKVLKRAEFKKSLGTDSYRESIRKLPTVINEYNMQLDEARGEKSVNYIPAVPVMVSVLNTTADDKTLADLYTAYVDECGIAWSKSTRSANNTVFKFLKMAVGAKTPLSKINRDVSREVLEQLKRLPKNWGKHPKLKALTLNQLIIKAEKLGLPLNHKRTINDSYLAAIKPMFEWAKNEQWIDRNHFAGLMLRQSNKEKAKDFENKRRPFQIEQLQELFMMSPWTDDANKFVGKTSLYWCPLISLFHGFRRGEVCGLLVSDILEDEGISVFMIRQHFDENEVERSLKTDNSSRVVPIHPELIKIGFITFVKKQRTRGFRQLFPEAKPDANGKWGRHLTEWFGKHMRAIETEQSNCTFHSLRHNFQDALRASGLHGTAEGQALSGRKTDYRAVNMNADTVADEYGSRFKSSTLVPLISKVKYVGLNLTHLHNSKSK